VKEKIRQCIACKNKKDRKFFIRILEDFVGRELIIEPHRKEFGRSLYICKNKECVYKLKKHKRYKDKLDFEKIEQTVNNDSWNKN
jgi:uncharacterized protein